MKKLQSYLDFHDRTNKLLTDNYVPWTAFWTFGPIESHLQDFHSYRLRTIYDITVVPLLASFYNGFIEKISAGVSQWQFYGRDLVKNTPLLNVDLGVEPFRWIQFDKTHYVWRFAEVSTAGIFNNYRLPDDFENCWDRYDSVEEAKRVASRAAVNWARKQVGFQPLDRAAHEVHLEAM